MDTVPTTEWIALDPEYLSTVLFVLITSTVELVKYMMKSQSEKFKVLLPFILLGAGFLWGGVFGLWVKGDFIWKSFKYGAERGIYVACVSGVSYGIFKSFRQVRDGIRKNGGNRNNPEFTDEDNDQNSRQGSQ
ncbi:hypothetical protein HM1_2028 [Heliomicrobium modesticaldum Ice1]|uniref:Uncharacterized protein n=1 Tax=Heliobacterium modesticaldum (strain ATCC 51547 / Ice1) TaxID=498761 RepID=B0TG89_HELMI|nr:hypothetical protein [Heliomicrobium modesticaldum]ABZ84585.1 hypothetical protein HM1_2028 [Heliomicrobium modesticaldum Ice1]